MKKLPQISNTEWQVMKILWASPPLTANEVIFLEVFNLRGFTPPRHPT